MREKHNFGKRSSKAKPQPNTEIFKETFGITNNGCDSQQIIEFIQKTTGITIEIEKQE